MKYPIMRYIILLSFLFATAVTHSQTINYPYPVQSIHLSIEQQPVKMAYMDIAPNNSSGKVIVLLHGKNFNGYYWKDLIPFLTSKGFRVIVPDQVGWGQSDKPNIHYSFHLLSTNTKHLLDSLNVKEIYLLGHSMGGMLAARFALLYPGMVKKLILENPIGLEDYKTFIPYKTVEATYATELKLNLDSLKNYQKSYFPEWKPEYDQYVSAQYEALQIPGFKTATWASALTYQMIYEQPVVYEFKDIKVPTCIIIGQSDRTVVGKKLLLPEEQKKHGDYPKLGKWLRDQIRHSTLVELEGVGHIPHIQVPEVFKEKLSKFLME